MILRYVIPFLALLGIVGAVVFTTQRGAAPTPPARQLSEPPATPYQNTVSGTGVVEASSRNIQVGSELSGIVAEVMVQEGSSVAKDAPLFALDTRRVEAAVALAKAAVIAASVALADEQDQLKRAEGLRPGQSISVDLLQRRRFAVKRAQAALMQAQAEQKSAETTLALHHITAPIDGVVLKVRLRKGEFVAAGAPQAPLVMGAAAPYFLRVTIDENDLWRYKPEAKAVAVLRSHKEAEFALKFISIEPLVLPKKDLSGDPSEKVDTRVLEVLYEIAPPSEGATPLYIGQQMDVFIEG